MINKVIEEEELLDLSKPHVSREQIEKFLGFKPMKIDLYKKALVHKSVQKHVKLNLEKGNIVQDYMKESLERLEYLGDSVLGFVVSNLVFDKYPDSDEGHLTRIKIKLVRGENCAKLAKILGLGEFILTGSSKMKDPKTGHVINNSVLEDSFEAIIGAIYKDIGFKHAELFITKLINENINFEELCSVDDNYKDILMRYTQTYKYELPEYRYTRQDINQLSTGTLVEGQEIKERKFLIEVYLKKKPILSEDGSILKSFEKKLYGVATCQTKKLAEQEAAKNSMCFKYKEYIPDKEICSDKKCNKIHMDELDMIINRRYEPKE
jgi:ribonuclease-3